MNKKEKKYSLIECPECASKKPKIMHFDRTTGYIAVPNEEGSFDNVESEQEEDSLVFSNVYLTCPDCGEEITITPVICKILLAELKNNWNYNGLFNYLQQLLPKIRT